MAKGSGGGGGKGGSGGVGGRSSRSVSGDKTQAKAIRKAMNAEHRNARKRDMRAQERLGQAVESSGLFKD